MMIFLVVALFQIPLELHKQLEIWSKQLELMHNNNCMEEVCMKTEKSDNYVNELSDVWFECYSQQGWYTV